MSLPECSKRCKELGVGCPVTDCKMWIDYPEEKNCCLISIDDKEKGLTLHEVAERLKINYLKVRQIEIRALKRLNFKKELKNLFYNEL
tara:strand:- start:1906 stop:2169 length:264 start_codon:yes stop_codon:yes gene_type:complete